MASPRPDSSNSDGAVVLLRDAAARFSCAPLAELASVLAGSGSSAAPPSATVDGLLRALRACDDELNADRRALADALQLAREDVARLHAVNGELACARDSARERARDLESKLRDTTRDAAAASGEVERLQREIQPLTEVVEAREKAHAVQMKLVAELQATIAELKERNVSMPVNPSKFNDNRGSGAEIASQDLEAMTKERNILAAQLKKNQAIVVKLQEQLNEVEEKGHVPTFRETRNPAVARASTIKKTGEAEIHVTLINSEEEQDLRFSVADVSAMFAENEKLRAAEDDLIKTIERQKQAHKQLRTTVNDLMEDIKARPTKMEFLDVRAQYVQAGEENLILSRKLKKLTAEYNAVSAAHAISNAELSKLRSTSEEPGKRPRDRTEQGNISRLNGILGNVENILNNHHHRPKNATMFP